MFRRIAVIFSFTGLVSAAFGQDSGGWKKFGTSSGDQAYAVNQPVPQNSQVPQNYAPAANVPSQITLPAGTFVRVRINEKLSSDKNQPGDFFTATLVQPLVANGLVVAQAGQNIAGRVSEAVKAKDGNGRSRLGLELTELSLVDGQQMPIRTQLMEYRRPTNNGRDTGVVFGTTAAGAAIGAAAGGGFGAGVGAITGAAAGAIGVLATRAHATEIHPEAMLTFRTIDSATIATDRSGDAFQPVRNQQSYHSEGQPVQRAVAPPAPYYGGYDPYYYPYGYYPYGYYPYGGFYGYGYPGFGVVIRGGGFGGGFRGGFRGGRR
jgi:outer membrane lipoprotein SlyB